MVSLKLTGEDRYTKNSGFDFTPDTFSCRIVMPEANPLSMSFRRQVLGLVAWLLIAFAAAASGAFATGIAIGNWYPHIAKPAWTAPTWVFPPVWTTLFVFMAVSAWLVWRQGGFVAAPWSLLLFLAQLALNSVWSAIFFAMGRLDLASVQIVALWIVLILTCIAFWRRSRPAALLLIPYWMWVTYLMALTIQIARMNPRHPL